MIHIIYSKLNDRCPAEYHFCGVFKEEQEAKNYMASLPPANECRLQTFPEFHYPLYLIEKDFKKAAAIPISREDLAREMAKVSRVDDEDHVYFNYYRFVEDYRGIVPGERYWTMTDHHHVDNDMIMWRLEAALEREEAQAIDLACRLGNEAE